MISLLKWKTYYPLIGFLCFFVQGVSGQDQKIADSLARIYNNTILEDTAKMELLRNLSYNEMRDLNLGLKYADELISLAKKNGSNKYLHIGYFQREIKKDYWVICRKPLTLISKVSKPRGRQKILLGSEMITVPSLIFIRSLRIM